ncbi:C-C chemokine receptor type 3-like [Heptranchias perlo]|uniref:C-C chemokine receptor type 3-like n=1 Tax=Heptranchias perlo TaxID=212740 RepID=UPI00355A7297
MVKEEVFKMLAAFKVETLPGPDVMQPRLLAEVRMEITEVLATSFQSSLDMGAVPEDGVIANFTSLLKKGESDKPVNLVTIVILSRGKCGLSKCVTRSLVAMAAADLLVVIIDLILRQIPITFHSLFVFVLEIKVCHIHAVLLYAATDCSVWFTVTFTFDRFVAICCQRLKTKYCTEKTAACHPFRRSSIKGFTEIQVHNRHFLSPNKLFCHTLNENHYCVSSITEEGPLSLFSHFQSIFLLFLTVNLIAIVILSRGKCRLSTCTTRYLVAMAGADLLVIITEVVLTRINYYYFPICFLEITPVCSVIAVLTHAAIDCSVWFTVTFSFDRFVAICCQKLKTKYCTGKTAAVILATTCILLFLKDVPFHLTFEPVEIIDNLPWFCTLKTTFFTEPGWVSFNWIDTILNPLLPFTLILFLNALTVRHILVSSRVRKGLRGQSKGDNRNDPEMESRRKSMILLFTISGSFILLWLTIVVDFFYYNIAGTSPLDYNDSLFTLQQVGYMLQNLSSCTNTFIYAVTQSKFREHFKSAVKYPVTLIIKLIN